MDGDNKHERNSSVYDSNMEESSSWLSYLFMTYLDGLFKIGNERTLKLSDLKGIAQQDKSEVLQAKFSAVWDEEMQNNNKKKTLWPLIWRTVGYRNVSIAVILFGISAGIQFGPVLILTKLVKYFTGLEDMSLEMAWMWVCMLFVLPIISSVTLVHSNIIMAHIAAQVRNLLIGVIYRKTLRLSSASRQLISTGRIVTMFSADTNLVKIYLGFFNNFYCAPLQIAACLYLLYQQVGISTLVGISFAFFCMPVNGLIFANGNAWRRVKMTFTDQRIKIMNEILSGIRIIKYYGWEEAFMKKISLIRETEINILKRIGYLNMTLLTILLHGAPFIQTVVIFLTYVSLGNQLDATTAFTTLTLFGLMNAPVIFIPFGLQQYSQSLIATTRIMVSIVLHTSISLLIYML